MNRIFDFHTHTFPDRIAGAAVEKLQAASHTAVFSDGTAAGLRASMQRAGIEASLVLPVATNARQVSHVNDAAIAMNNEGAATGLYSLGCMHPDYADFKAELSRIAAAGIRGIKLHPIYQGVDFDDIRYLRILSRCAELGLLVLIHAGWDVGYPGINHASPCMVLHALQEVGPCTLVLAHMGGWRVWEEAAQLLPGSGVFLDTSFSLGGMTPCGDGHYKAPQELKLMEEQQFVRMVRAFGADHVLFGTDCPWDDQAAALHRFCALPFSRQEQQAMLWDNAARLLGI